MRMQKGLCIELNDKSSIFLGPSGEFVEGKPVGEMAVGDQGYFYPRQAAARKKRQMLNPVMAPVIAALAVAALFLSVLLPEPEAYAYVQVQVNPGIELGIDDDCKVISVRGLNEDGNEMIERLPEWEDHPLEEVLGTVVSLSLKKTTDEIVITTVASEEDRLADEAIADSVLAISAKAVTENITVRLKEASKKQWRSSVEKQIPVGQMISHSEKLQKKEMKKEKMEQPYPVKEPKPAADESQQKGQKADGRSENEDKPAKGAEDNNSNAGEKDGSKKTPPAKEKQAPPGQDKRKETPAADKGNPNPPGQDKRTTVPGQDKKPVPPKQPADKGKGEAPGQQKKKEDNGKNNGNNGNGNSPQKKGPEKKPEPAKPNGKNDSGKQGPPSDKGNKDKPGNNAGNDKANNKNGNDNQ